MFDAKSVLDGLLKAKMSGSTQQRVEHAVGPEGLGGQGGLLEQLGGLLGQGGAGGQGGGLGGLLSQLGGGASGGQGGGLGGLLNQLGGGTAGGQGGGQSGGLGGLLNQLGGAGGQGGGLGNVLGGLAEAASGAFNKTSEAVKQNNPAAVGGLGALAGLLLGGKGGAVGGGLMAVLGSLAYSAMQNMGTPSAPGSQATAPSGSPTSAPMRLPPGLAPVDDPIEEARTNTAALIVIRAMINAAKADGQIDQDEMQRITGELQESGADEEARAFVIGEMKKPFDLEGLLANVPDREVGIQVYAATLLAIEIDTPAEREYVDTLASRLGLDGSVVANIHRTLGIA